MERKIPYRLAERSRRLTRRATRYYWRLHGQRLEFEILIKNLKWRFLERRHADRWVELARQQRWIFILGCNNSGTTLLYRILSNHPKITPLSDQYEGKNLTRQLPRSRDLGCGRTFTERLDVFRWTEASDPVDLGHLAYDWLFGKRWDPNQFILEKSPEHTLSSRWLQKVFPESYFIGLVRNGYAVAEGIRRRTGRSIEECARHWNTVNRIMIEDAAYLKNFHLVTYEALSTRPEFTLRGIAEFLEIDYAPFQPLMVKQWKVHSVAGVPSKIQDFNRDSFKRLSADEVAVIRQASGEMLANLGYMNA